ncbi:hypothetical protein PUR28_27815 [Streptomyces sp. BE308]|uniref:hypothetical protein n=1 Tax=Streptomyces sp. BE308 TaxID=3002529 RepID=UPI002E7725E5|nr:hypothetical protein [Streptomyces sp. BE308]MEE1794536.1 hypothetical protein [Streptomyces sp. BE308]
MAMVPWEELQRDEKRYAALVSMLLLRLRPRARAVEGAGGDGGKDVYEYDEDNHLIVYELKSFTGRLTGGRRNQVKKSLMAAAQHQPDAWDLVVPVRPTAGEWSWFEGLRKDYPFVRELCGLVWLNEKLALHDDLVRAAVQGPDGYLLDRIADARAERDVLLGGVPDLAERYETLMRRASEISPHYGLTVSRVECGGTEIAIAAKDPRTVDAAPILVEGELVFPDDPASAEVRSLYERAVHYGGDVDLPGAHLRGFRISAPAELGISGPLPLYEMRMRSHRELLVPALSAQLSVVGGAGLPLQSVPLRFYERSRGARGATLFGSDVAGLIEVQLRLDPGAGSWQVDVSFCEPREYPTPATALPILQVMAHARAGAVVRLAFHAQQMPSTLESVLDSDWTDGDFRTWAGLCADLRFIQEATNTSFPIPREMSGADASGIRQAARLLRGEAVSLGRGPLTLSVNQDRAAALDVFSAGRQRLVLAREVTFQLDGWSAALGTCVEYCVVEQPSRLAQVREEVEAGRSASLRLSLPPGERVYRQLLAHVPVEWLPPGLAAQDAARAADAPGLGGGPRP